MTDGAVKMEEDIIKPIYPQCSICLDYIDGEKKLKAKLNSCSHIFCSTCILEWAQTRAVCPNCKNGFYKIATYQPTDPNSNVK